MEKLNEEIILSYLYKFDRVYDNKNSTAYIVDKGESKRLSFFRAIGDPGTDEYINEQIYNEFGKFASEPLLKRILKMLVYDTRKNGKEEIVHYRVANTKKAIYVNMGTGSILKITAKDIVILKKASVKFTIHNTLGKMAIPDLENGDIKFLKKYILVNQSEFKLIFVFIFNCFLLKPTTLCLF